MTPASIAAAMLTYKTRDQALDTVATIVKTRGGVGRCAAFWADVGAALRASAVRAPSNDAELGVADDDVFSFSAEVKAQMGRVA